MITPKAVENLLACELSEHFTKCGADQATYAGLVLDDVDQGWRTVTPRGRDKESGTPFTAIVRTTATVCTGDQITDPPSVPT